MKRQLHSHEPDADIDDEYHSYLWGEEAPRAFARRRQHRTAKPASESPRLVRVEVGDFDPADAVAR